MSDINLNQIADNIYKNVIESIEVYIPKLFGAFVIIGIGLMMAYGIFKFVMFLFKKFKIIELIDKLNIEFESEKNIKRKEKSTTQKIENEKITFRRKISDKIKIDEITAKASAYYVFLVFFRLSIVIIGIKEVENFLGDLLTYLPSLFVGVLIGFFGIRFANFIYDVVFHALDLTKQKTAKIIASSAKVMILFFTLMAVLSKIGIANEITNTILIGFISMVAIAGGLAFGLGGKDVAHEILENLKK